MLEDLKVHLERDLDLRCVLDLAENPRGDSFLEVRDRGGRFVGVAEVWPEHPGKVGVTVAGSDNLNTIGRSSSDLVCASLEEVLMWFWWVVRKTTP